MLGNLPLVIDDYIPEGTRRPGYSLDAQSITIHCLQSKLSIKDQRDLLCDPKNDNISSYHYIVDDNITIATIPEDEVAWHAGCREGNYSSIAVMVSFNEDHSLTWQNSVGLIAMLLYKRGWSIDKVTSHKRWTGMNCPAEILPRWDEFLLDIQETLNRLIEFRR